MARLFVILLTVIGLLRPAPMLAAPPVPACASETSACCQFCVCVAGTLAVCCCDADQAPLAPRVPPPASGERAAIQWHAPSPGVEVVWPRPAHWPLHRTDTHAHGRTRLPEGGRSIIGSWVV